MALNDIPFAYKPTQWEDSYSAPNQNDYGRNTVATQNAPLAVVQRADPAPATYNPRLRSNLNLPNYSGGEYSNAVDPTTKGYAYGATYLDKGPLTRGAGIYEPAPIAGGKSAPLSATPPSVPLAESPQAKAQGYDPASRSLSDQSYDPVADFANWKRDMRVGAAKSTKEMDAQYALFKKARMSGDLGKPVGRTESDKELIKQGYELSRQGKTVGQRAFIGSTDIGGQLVAYGSLAQPYKPSRRDAFKAAVTENAPSAAKPQGSTTGVAGAAAPVTPPSAKQARPPLDGYKEGWAEAWRQAALGASKASPNVTQQVIRSKQVKRLGTNWNNSATSAFNQARTRLGLQGQPTDYTMAAGARPIGNFTPPNMNDLEA